MMAKHAISIYDMCRDGKRHSEEMWNEKITDHINYLLLLRAIVTEDELYNDEEMMDFNQDPQKSEADDLIGSWKELWHEIGEEERISGNT